MKKILSLIVCLCSTTLLQAQVNMKIGSGAHFVVGGGANVVMGTGNFVNDGAYYDDAGVFKAGGGINFSGSGTTQLYKLMVDNAGSSVMNAPISVYDLTNLLSGSLNANNQLYVRSDASSTARLDVTGVLTNDVHGILTRSTVTSGSCPSYTTNLSLNISGPAVLYQWQRSADNISWTNEPGATSSTYTATVSAPCYFRCYTTTNNSSYAQATSVVTQNFTGSSSPITGPTTVVAGSSILLENAVASGTWSSPSSNVSVDASSGSVTGVNAGTAVVSYTNPSGCVSTTVVSVSASITPITGTLTVCSGSTVTLSSTPTGGTWSSDNTTVASVDGSGVVTGGTAGTATIVYAVSGQTTTAIVTVNAAPTNAFAAHANSILCYGGSTGVVTTYVTGTAPLTWAWSNGAATPTLTGVMAGAYTYTVSNTCGSVTGGATVTQPAAMLVPSNTVSNVACNGGSTGSVSVTATGGTSPYAGTGNFTGQAAGTYTFTVTDANGCSANTVATVTQPAAALAASNISTNVQCFGASTGSVSVTATGGTSPYSGIGNFTGLTAGTHSFTVTDANGCTATTSGTISQPASALAAASTATNVLCFGASTGSVSVTATGGTSPYSGTGNFTGKAAGTHSFTVTDSHGCTATTSATVTQPASAVAASSTATDVLCYGGSTGSVSVSATGGIAPYIGTGNYTGKSVGSYSYTVTDANGCTSATTATVGQPAAALMASNTTTDVLCYGGSTGTVSVTATGGTSPYAGTGNYTGKSVGSYTYTVTDANGCTYNTVATVGQPASALSAANTTTSVLCYGGSTGSVSVTATGGTSPYAGTGNYTGKSVGSYTYTVTDANGCTYNTVATVGQPASALAAASTATNVLCFGGSTGSVSVTATGGTSPYSGTGNFSGQIAGTHSFTVTDANGCTATTSSTVGQPAAALSVSNSVTDVFCYGASTGVVTVNATGGTSPYSGTGTYSGKSAGSYTYTVTDANGCTASTVATVNQPAAGVVASNSVTHVLCYGNNTGSVLVSATGGVTPYTGTGNMTGLAAGTYTFVVTDAQGCSSGTVATVTQPTQLVASQAVTNVRCYNEGNGQVIVSASGGVTPYSGTGTFSNLSPAPYSYTVTDAHGCTSTVSGTITQPALLVASNTPAMSASGFNLLCNKGATGSATVSAVGGTTPYSNTGVHGGYMAGSYEIYVTDAHGCIDSTSFTLSEPAPFYINTDAVYDTICNGGADVISATGGVGTFTWYANNGLPSTITTTGAPTVTPTTGIPTTTVTYVAIGYNGLGCPSEPDSVDVTVLPIGYFSGPDAVCTDFSVDLDNGTPGGVWFTPDTAFITLDQNGLVTAAHEIVGNTYPTYTTITYTMPNGCHREKVETVNITPRPVVGIGTICPSSGLSLPAGIPSGGNWVSSNSNISVTVASNGIATIYGNTLGTANVSYVMPTGCYAYKTFSIAPIDDITGPPTVCAGNTIQLSHTLPGAQWSINMPSLASINISTGVLTGISAGSVVATYRINPTCYATYPVTVNTTPVDITGGTTVCEGSPLTLTNTTPGGTWTSVNTAAGTIGSTSGIVTGMAAGTTDISYTLSNGCAKGTTVTVNLTPASITGPNNVCVTRTAQYTSATTGGSWSSSSSILGIGAGSGLANGIATGNATIYYTLPTGCRAVKPVTVAAMPANITGTTNMCAGGSTTLTCTTASLTWSSTNTVVATVATGTTTTGIVSGLVGGTSTISYTSAAGCTQTVNVTVYASPDTIAGSASLCVGSTAVYTNSVTGGTWLSSATGTATVGSSSGIVTGIGAGVFNLTYTLPGGCRVIRALTVYGLPNGITASSYSTCVGGTTTLNSTTTGGTWTSVSTGVATIGASTGVVTGAGVGTSLISYTNAQGCARVATVTVGAGLPAIAGTASICVGGSATLTDATTGGTWASSNTPVATIISTSGIISGVTTGVTTVTYRTSPTCFTTTSVTVMSAPASITGPANTVCTGASLQLSHGITGGTWISSNTAKATVSSTGLVSGVAFGNATISYMPSAGCVTGYAVTVNQSPASITGTFTVCDGSNTTLASTTTGGTWLSGNTLIGTVGNTTGIVTGIDPGTVTITYKINATGCTATKDVTVNPLPNAIVGHNSICAGLADTFTSTTPGGTWSSSLTTVATINATTGILSAVAGGNTTLNYILPVTGCRATKVFTVYALPATGITGTPSVCEGATTTLNCTTAGLTWSSTNTAKATIVATSTTMGTVTGVAAGTSTISYTNANGCARTVIMTVNTSPASIMGNNVMCVGKIDTLTDATAGGTWNSSIVGAATIGATTGYITGVAGGTTLISYTLANGCRKTRIQTVNALPGTISGAGTVCAGNTTTLTATTAGSTWSSSSTAVATVVTGTTTTGIVTGGTTTGTATISYTNAAGCSRTTIVTVGAAVPGVTGPNTICVGTTGTFISGTGGTWSSSDIGKATIVSSTGVASGVAVGTSNITYKLNATCFAIKTVTMNAAVASPITGTTNVCVGATTTLNCATTGGTWSSSNTTNATIGSANGIVTGEAVGTSTITYMITTTGCFRTQSVNVLASPATITGSLTIAAGTSATLANTVTGGTWSSSATGVASIGLSSGIMNGLTVGTSNITYKLSNGCSRTALATIVVSGPRPIKGTEMEGKDVAEIKIYPNPTSRFVSIEAPSKGSFLIYTIDGKQVGIYDVVTPVTSIELPSNLVAGIYMCRYHGEDGSDVVVRLVYTP